MADRRPRLELVTPASPEEAAAITAAVERFLRDHASPAAPPRTGPDPWTRAARLEGARLAGPAGRSPWGDGHPWGIT